MKKHFFIVFLGAVFGFLTAYYIILSDTEVQLSLSLFQTISACLVGVVSAYIFYFSSLVLDKIIPWYKNEASRLLLGVVTHFFLCVIFVSGILYLYENLFLNATDFFTAYKAILIKLAIILFILIVICDIVYFALYSYYSYTTFQIETVKQDRRQIELQLKALKAQLSPHFLFNSLNTISSLIYKDETKAEAFIRKLAAMYQYMLQSYHSRLITIEEELDFVKSYQFLLQTRFADKVVCNINIDDAVLQHKIPPLTLQMLIENAVKHNQLDEKNPLTIDVFTEGNYLVVHNNITEKPNQVVSFNIGLKNINTRYLLLSKKGIVVSNGTAFTVKLPIIV